LKLYNTIDQRSLQSIHAHISSLTISYLCKIHVRICECYSFFKMHESAYSVKKYVKILLPEHEVKLAYF